MRRSAVVVFCLTVVYVCYRALGVWRLRLCGGRIIDRIPNAVCPPHFSVLPPPDAEYVGVWDVTPPTARQRLTDSYGFDPLARAYFHAYDRAGRRAYERGSFVRRPDGLFGEWQLHIRLFRTDDDRTELWAHWERNPYVSPIAHLRQEGYDPAEGERRIRATIDEPIDGGQPPTAAEIGAGD